MADLERLLLETSRTFAAAIPLLEEPVRQYVGTAYLLLRIADTLEDAASWAPSERRRALADFEALVQEPDFARAAALGAAWADAAPSTNASYLELLRETPAVLRALASYPPSVRAILVKHVNRTSAGMADVVARSSEGGALALRTLEDLRGYCYIVAGIVGELLTELFLDAAPGLGRVRDALWQHAAAFGEGLQLVNILKDEAEDAQDGRVFLPPGVDRAAVFALARADLRAATAYVSALQSGGAPRGFVAFCALPALLADAALTQTERFGPGSKISRAEVMTLMQRLDRALEAGTPAMAAGAA